MSRTTISCVETNTMSAPRPDNSLAAALSTLNGLETERVGREASRKRALDRAREQKLHLERLKRDYAELRRTTEALGESEARRREAANRERAMRRELEQRLARVAEHVERESKLRRTKIELEMLEAGSSEPKVGAIVATLAGAAAAAFALALLWVPGGHTAAELGLLEAQADVEAKKIALADTTAELEELEASIAELGAAAEARRIAAQAKAEAEPETETAAVETAEAAGSEKKIKRIRRNTKSNKPSKPAPKTENEPTRPPINLDEFGDDPLGGLGS